MNKLKTDTHLLQTTVTGSSGLFITNEDNMLLMSRYPDNYFDLAIVDPPYGIDLGNNSDYFAFKGGIRGKKGLLNDKKDWDKYKPNKDYWDELFRVSKNQIVWGANFFIDTLPLSRGWICWDKKQPEKNTFSDFDLAWTSFDCINRTFRMYPTHVTQGPKTHPSQKPIKLYEFCLKYYTKEGDKILDTHLGSGTIAIAVDNFNKIESKKLTLTACEIDKDYYTKSISRINQETNWQSLF